MRCPIEELILRVKNGDLQAASQLVELQREIWRKTLLSQYQLDDQTTDDYIQFFCLKFLDYAKSYDAGEAIESGQPLRWLNRVFFRNVRRFKEKLFRESHPEFDVSSAVDSPSGLSDEHLDVLHRAILQLSKSEQLRINGIADDLSNKEFSKQFELAESSVGNTKYRLCDKLEKILAKMGYDPSYFGFRPKKDDGKESKKPEESEESTKSEEPNDD